MLGQVSNVTPESAQVGLTLTQVGGNGGVRSRLVELLGTLEFVCVRYFFVAIAVGHVAGFAGENNSIESGPKPFPGRRNPGS